MAAKIIGAKRQKVALVRILIGTTETGSSKIQAPTRTITIEGISVEEAHAATLEAIKNIK